jgi:hypothetical protein
VPKIAASASPPIAGPAARAASEWPAGRPLRTLSQAQLQERFERALGNADGFEGAHCIHEAWMRGEFPARIEAALARLWEKCAASIPEWLPMRYVTWLPQVYEIAQRFQARAKGRMNIYLVLYLVLLDFSDRRGDAHGLYVGMSAYAPAHRFDQHKAGIRAAGSVLKRGLELLGGPTMHLRHIAREEAVRIEAGLADALRDAGVLTEGGH